MYNHCKVNLTLNVKRAMQNSQSKLWIFIEGDKSKNTKKERKLSQEELTMKVGTTRQTITSIEVGKYTASLVLAYKIAKYILN